MSTVSESESNTFIDKPLDEIAERVEVESFAGKRILCVDGYRIGDAVSTADVSREKAWLVSALEDLERLFTDRSGVRRAALW